MTPKLLQRLRDRAAAVTLPANSAMRAAPVVRPARPVDAPKATWPGASAGALQAGR